MDVVRSNIERIGGSVDVASTLGQGTVFTIKIPLTLAIIPALIVTAGDNRYAIPQVNLLELVRLESSEDGKGLERLQSSDFYRLRGKLLPLVYLSRQLSTAHTRTAKPGEEHVLNIVVVRADHHQFGLVVDEIHDTEEIVVKPLGRLLKGLNSYAGATIMGDGQVALILDVVGLGRNARITRKEASVKGAHDTHSAEGHEAKQKLLVFKLTDDRRAAVPLEQVYRLEEFPLKTLEHAGGTMVVQYRDGILPLVDVRMVLSHEATDLGELVRAFVYHDGTRLVGFVVNEIVDIVEQAVKIERPYQRAGVLGSAIIQQHVTDLVDLREILVAAGMSSATSVTV
jgi:two-component system chemotaxis sensor kinase CheA